MVDSLKERKRGATGNDKRGQMITYFLGLFKVAFFAISVEMKSKLVHMRIHIEYRALFNMKSTP